MTDKITESVRSSDIDALEPQLLDDFYARNGVCNTKGVCRHCEKKVPAAEPTEIEPVKVEPVDVPTTLVAPTPATPEEKPRGIENHLEKLKKFKEAAKESERLSQENKELKDKIAELTELVTFLKNERGTVCVMLQDARDELEGVKKEKDQITKAFDFTIEKESSLVVKVADQQAIITELKKANENLASELKKSEDSMKIILGFLDKN